MSRAYRADGTIDAVYSRDDCLAAFAEADAAIICMPSDAETRGFVDRVKFAVMKRTALLVNISRGDIVVEEDLIQACRTGVIEGAGLDVAVEEPLPPESALWTLDNVVITPHVGGTGSDETEMLIGMIAENLHRYLAGLPLLREVAY